MKLSMHCQNCQSIQERTFDDAKVTEKRKWPSGGDPTITHDTVLVDGKAVACVNCGSNVMNMRQRTETAELGIAPTGAKS